MGHGNRWEAVGGRDADSVVQHTIPLIFQYGGAMPGVERRVVWPGGEGPGEVVSAAPVGIFVSDDPFVFCAITLPKPKAEGSVLMTAYPMPGQGIKRRLIIRDREEHCLGLEGWIDAETESSVPINFFATDYYFDSARYAKGSAVDVLLSGLAYNVEAAAPREIVIDDPEALRGYRESGMLVREGEPVRISTQGAAILFPIENCDPFDYQFQGVLKQHSQIVCADRPVHCLTVTVSRAGDDDIDLPVLACEHVLRGEIPPLGADVAGSMCIMGRRAD